MRYKAVLSSLLAVTILLFACKKNMDVKEQTAKKVNHRWQIDSIVTTQKLNNVTTTESLSGNPDDYIEFSDGKMRTHFRGNNDVTSYSVKDEKTIIISGDSAYILELTEQKFTIHTRAQAGSLGFIDITYYLRK